MEVKKTFLAGKYPEQINLLKQQITDGNSFLKLVNEKEVSDIYLAFDLVDPLWLNNPKNQKVFKVLIRQEPQIVLPQTYATQNIAKFDYVIDIGKPKTIKNTVLNWPQDLTSYIKTPRTKADRVVMVNSNLLSLLPGENYSLRRLAAKQIINLDLFGYQWNNSLSSKLMALFIELKKHINELNNLKIKGLNNYFRSYDNYLGEVKDKRQMIANYKYCLVIENSSTYVSEKLFDSLLSGCIPIYVGPDLAEHEIPNHLYLQAKPNLDDIKLKINEAIKINYTQWVDNLNLWLTDQKVYENWSNDLFLLKIVKIIQKNYQ